jgi:hypothetical protein
MNVQPARRAGALGLGSIGVVDGDVGTSPPHAQKRDKAIVIFRNIFIPSWKSWLPRTKTVPTARLFQRLTGGSKQRRYRSAVSPDEKYRKRATDTKCGDDGKNNRRIFWVVHERPVRGFPSPHLQ